MSTINFSNPRNLPSLQMLGADTSSTEGMSAAYFLGDVLTTGFNAYKDFNSRLTTQLSNWVVTSVETVPGGAAGSLTRVQFENGNYKLSLAGTLTNNGASFSLSGRSISLELDNVPGDYSVDILLTSPWQLGFQQNETSKTYENQTNYYNGNTTAAPSVTGALPIGAKLTSVGQGQIPTAISQVGLDTGESYVSLQGSFNVGPISPQNSTLRLGGTLTGVKDFYFPDSGQGMAIRTFIIDNGSFDSSRFVKDSNLTSNPSDGFTFSQASLPSIRNSSIEQSDAVGVVNFTTLQFEFSSPGLPSPAIARTDFSGGRAIALNNEIGLVDKLFFAGNDTFNAGVTTTTDVAIFAGAGNDSVTGGSGNDFIYGGQGNDTLNGGAGHDLFVVNQGGNNRSTNSEEPPQTSPTNPSFSITRLGRDLIDGGTGLDTLSFDTGNNNLSSRPANLQLILPAQWFGGATSARGNGSPNYVTPDGLLGKLVDNSRYGEIVAPSTDSLGFIFKNSATTTPGVINDEYVVVKNVEYLEIASQNGFTTYDIRPLYLATTGNDTLHAFTRTNFDSFVRILDTSGLRDTSSDPLSLYRNNFAIDSFSWDSNNNPIYQWRYYLNSGSGNDTLHGTQESSVQTQTTFINLELDGLGTNTSVNFRAVTSGTTPSTRNFTVTFNGNASDFNRALAAELMKLNPGILAQRGSSNEQVIVTGLSEAGVSLSSTSTSVVREISSFSIRELGRDVLDGGTGADVMIGYSGSDSYYVDNAADQVIESGWHTGFDTVLATTTYSLAVDASVERLMVHQIIPKSDGTLWAEPLATAPVLANVPINLTGNNFTFEYLGHDGANTITAGQFSGFTPLLGPKEGALLMGMGGDDRLVGGDLDDHFFGGTGNDNLVGGAGSDSFYMGFGFADQYASALLPTQYSLLGQLGAINNPVFLTGGNDTVVGGAGYDVVVAGVTVDLSRGFESQLSFQRISETQIRISTVAESIVVDNTVEAVRFMQRVSPTGPAVETEVLLPWVVSSDEVARDLYYSGGYSGAQSQINPPVAYAPSSAFSDFIDLNYYPYASSYESASSFDAGDGNDVIKGAEEPSGGFATIRGGNGDDWVYGGGYIAENDAWVYSLYGDAGNDTLTLRSSLMEGTGPKVLLDGGAGNDHYRISQTDLLTTSPDIRIRIEDSSGTDRLTLTLPDDELAPQMLAMWEGNELRVLRVQEDDPTDRLLNTQVYLSASLGSIEQLFVTGDDAYYSNDLWGGNLVNPSAAPFSNGRLTGTGLADVLLPIMGVSLNYDGGAGNDLILLGSVTGSVASGGSGNNLILVDDLFGRNPQNTLSYAWTPGGATAEIDLKSGYSFVADAAGTLLGTDRFETGSFVNVIGGGANETIRGNESVNRLDGGFGDDVLFSGQNAPLLSPQAHEWRSLVDQTQPERDVLIGGAGNDILVEETHWGSNGYWTNQSGINGSLLDGGAGNDIYVLQHNGAPPGFVTPTKIVERNPNGTDAGGLDTIRFVTSDSGIQTYSFVQNGNAVRVTTSDIPGIKVGDLVLAAFNSGPTASNLYTVSAVIKDSNNQVTAFEFQAPNAATQSGRLVISEDPTIDGIGVWADPNTFALFSAGDTNESALDAVDSGRNMIDGFDGNSLNSDLSVQALIDRNAMEFMEFGTPDPVLAGVRLPVSFNVGRSAGLEVVMAGANGDAVLYGGAGTDMIIDSAWNDILIGGDGHDVLSSHFGKDILLGGAGNDSLRYRADGQVLVGGAGADTFVLRGLGDAPATLTDFKPWEGDKLIFDEDWLDRQEFTESLYKFEANVNGTRITPPINGFNPQRLSVVVDPWTNTDDHVTFKLKYDWSLGQNNYSASIDFLNVSISPDHDRAYEQILDLEDGALYQLRSSLI